jgi:hypothetical protein
MKSLPKNKLERTELDMKEDSVDSIRKIKIKTWPTHGSKGELGRRGGVGRGG